MPTSESDFIHDRVSHGGETERWLRLEGAFTAPPEAAIARHVDLDRAPQL